MNIHHQEVVIDPPDEDGGHRISCGRKRRSRKNRKRWNQKRGENEETSSSFINAIHCIVAFASWFGRKMRKVNNAMDCLHCSDTNDYTSQENCDTSYRAQNFEKRTRQSGKCKIKKVTNNKTKLTGLNSKMKIFTKCFSKTQNGMKSNRNKMDDNFDDLGEIRSQSHRSENIALDSFYEKDEDMQWEISSISTDYSLTYVSSLSMDSTMSEISSLSSSIDDFDCVSNRHAKQQFEMQKQEEEERFEKPNLWKDLKIEQELRDVAQEITLAAMFGAVAQIKLETLKVSSDILEIELQPAKMDQDHCRGDGATFPNNS
uniref:uncharacterized protein LOC120343024 n=1 Tax=Styela clava TaxID=7725 RepID=UPI00193A95FE|nr:uncharacterized protein LOC120343024 [Styela clava]